MLSHSQDTLMGWCRLPVYMLFMAIIMLCNKQLQILRAFNQRLFCSLCLGFLGDSWFWCCLLTSAGLAGCPLSSISQLCLSAAATLAQSASLLTHPPSDCSIMPSRKWQWPQMAMPIWASSLEFASITSMNIPLAKVNQGIKHRPGITLCKDQPSSDIWKDTRFQREHSSETFHFKAKDMVQWDKEWSEAPGVKATCCTSHGSGEDLSSQQTPSYSSAAGTSCRLIDGLLEWGCHFQRYLRPMMRTQIRARWETVKIILLSLLFNC